MPSTPPEKSPEFVETAGAAFGRWTVYRRPLVRACACSLAGHMLGIVVLAMTLVAAREGPQGAPSLAAGVSDDAANECEQLDAQAAEAAEAPLGAAPDFEIVGGVSEPVLTEVGDIKAASADDVLGDGGLLGSLADEIATASEAGQRQLGNSANFYGIDANGADFVFVVDMSGSMTGTRFRRAKSELRRSIEALSPTQRYFIIFFSDDAWPMPADGLIEASEKNLTATRRWLKNAACQGGTNPLPALVDALRLEPDAIFLLSDGKFDPDTAVQVELAEPSPRVPIHTIGFASREGEPMLKAISQISGGTYRYVR